MSYSQMQSVARPPSHSEQQLQLQLQTLLEHLQPWSYVALWSVDPQSRSLAWNGGHWRAKGADVWNEKYFTSTFKSSRVTARYGSVDVAFAEGKSIWMNGSDVPESAGSKEKAEFLQRTGISTALFVPFSNGVLELGTRENLPEDPALVDRIRHFLQKCILPTLGAHPSGYSQLVSQAPSSCFTPAASLRGERSSSLMRAASYASMGALRHLPESLGAQTFEPNSLNQQIIRGSGSMTSSLNPDVFLQQLDDATTEVGTKDSDSVLDPDMLLPADARSWRLPVLHGSNSRAVATSMTLQALQTPMYSAAHAELYYPPMQQRTRGKYRTRPGNTSASSVSSQEEAACSTRLPSVDSPEQNTSNNNMLFVANSQRQTSHSNTSSSLMRGTPSHSPEIITQLEDHSTHGNTGTTPSLQGNNRAEDEMHAIMMLANEGEPLDSHEPWRNLYSASLHEPFAGNMSQMNLLHSRLDPRLDSLAATSNENHHNRRFLNNGNNVLTGNRDSYMNGTHNSVVRSGLSQTIPGLLSHGPFKSWENGRVLVSAMQRNGDRPNQELLRRCIDMVKRIPHLQSGMQNEAAGQQPPPPQQQQQQPQQAVVQNVSQHGPRVASSSSPETVPVDNGFGHDPFDLVPSLRGRRPRGGSRISTMGPVHSGHDEAAMNHKLAERRRRVKQKEKFAALRKLVPIISKADKASILGDAIVYLKDQENTIENLKATCAETEKKYESLKMSYKELEQRNRELESMVCPPRLNHSM